MKRVDTQYESSHAHINRAASESVPIPQILDKMAPGGVRSARSEEWP